MLDLILAVACGLAIGMIFKLAGRRGLDRLTLLTVNYLTALLVGGVLFALEGASGEHVLPPGVGLLSLGFVQGLLFISGFFVLALATEIAGMSLAVGVMRVSVVVPFMASWVIWGETPSLGQGAGLAVAAVAFFLLARKDAPASSADVVPLAAEPPEQGRSGNLFAILALLFVVGGTADVGMKVFDEVFADDYGRRLFLMMVFGVAFLTGAAIVLYRWRTGRSGMTAAVAGWGTLLGLVNYGAAEFFLRAVEQLSGPFVFPAHNIGLVVGAALLGVWIWKERLSYLNWVGLALASIALVLLTR